MAFHQHDDAEEIIYVISGYGEIQIGSQKEQIIPGSAIYIPPSMKHSVIVKSNIPMKILFVFSPPQVPGAATETHPE